MNVALWIAAGLLALAMLGAGLMKLVRSPDQLRAAGMGWVDHAPSWAPKVIGLLEVLGAIGLILPALTGIAPILVPLAATGIAVLMLGAVVVHIRLKDSLREALPAIVLALLAIFVAWGRFGPYAF
ncbi:MAG: DoxX family protein [Candidatus Nanopelagicales bacterium]